VTEEYAREVAKKINACLLIDTSAKIEDPEESGVCHSPASHPPLTRPRPWSDALLLGACQQVDRVESALMTLGVMMLDQEERPNFVSDPTPPAQTNPIHPHTAHTAPLVSRGAIPPALIVNPRLSLSPTSARGVTSLPSSFQGAFDENEEEEPEEDAPAPASLRTSQSKSNEPVKPVQVNVPAPLHIALTRCFYFFRRISG